MDQILHTYLFKHFPATGMTKKGKYNRKKLSPWIPTTVRQAVGLQESLLDHLDTMHCIYWQLPNISFTCARQIKFARLLGLHNIAGPLGLPNTTLGPAL